MSGIALVAAASSVGIRQYADDLRQALEAAGIEAACVDRMAEARGMRAHAQFGNSTRDQLPALAFGRAPTLVTLHDVVPRDARLRAVLARPQARALSRHRVVVHSEHARAMLRDLGFDGAARVVRHAATERRLDDARRAALRREMSPEGRPILVVAGVLKRARGALAVLDAAPAFPEAVFAFVGDPGDAPTREALASAPSNVVHLPHRFGDSFYEPVAAADVLLNFRLDTVGETSGPMVNAHAWGTPMAAWAAGSIPEYRSDRDLLFAEGMPVRDAVAEVLDRLPATGRVEPGDPSVTPWSKAARLYAEEYAYLGWL